MSFTEEFRKSKLKLRKELLDNPIKEIEESNSISIPEEHQEVFEKLLETLPIYDIGETGCGHWTDTSGVDNNSREIEISEATDILEKIGIDIEQSKEENGIPYHMIPDYTQDQGIPGLYLPIITYDYILKYLLETDFGKCKMCNMEPDREDQNGPCSFAYTYACQATNSKPKK